MGTQFKEVGGGPSTGLANNFVNWLQQGLFGGNFGGQPSSDQRFMAADPVGKTGGISSVLNDILSGGAGKVGGALAQLINNQQTRDIGNMRARYGIGGMGYGTPGATGEALYRSEAAPQVAMAVSKMQMDALNPILQMIFGMSQKGVSQRQTVAQPDAFTSAIGTLAPVLGTVLSGPAGGLFSGKGSIPPIPANVSSLTNSIASNPLGFDWNKIISGSLPPMAGGVM